MYDVNRPMRRKLIEHGVVMLGARRIDGDRVTFMPKFFSGPDQANPLAGRAEPGCEAFTDRILPCENDPTSVALGMVGADDRSLPTRDPKPAIQGQLGHKGIGRAVPIGAP